jgi:hypothetical protein
MHRLRGQAGVSQVGRRMHQKAHKIKSNQIIDASAYFGPGSGSQFEGYPLPSSRLGSPY